MIYLRYVFDTLHEYLLQLGILNQTIVTEILHLVF